MLNLPGTAESIQDVATVPVNASRTFLTSTLMSKVPSRPVISALIPLSDCCWDGCAPVSELPPKPKLALSTPMATRHHQLAVLETQLGQREGGSFQGEGADGNGVAGRCAVLQVGGDREDLLGGDAGNGAGSDTHLPAGSLELHRNIACQEGLGQGYTRFRRQQVAVGCSRHPGNRRHGGAVCVLVARLGPRSPVSLSSFPSRVVSSMAAPVGL